MVGGAVHQRRECGPSPAIAATAICFNPLGDGLGDALNPRDER